MGAAAKKQQETTDQFQIVGAIGNRKAVEEMAEGLRNFDGAFQQQNAMFQKFMNVCGL